MSKNEIRRAAESGNFLALLQRLCPEHAVLFPDAPLPNYTIEEVEDAAAGAGTTTDLARDQLLAPLALRSRASVRAYTQNGGQKVTMDENCELRVTRNRGKPNEYELRVSSAMIIASEGHNSENLGAALQVFVRATNGKWNELFVTRTDLTKGDVQTRFVAAGLLPGDWKVINHLLQNIDPPHKFIALDRAGWTDGYYATPGGDVLPDDGKAVATFPAIAGFEQGGTLDGSRELLLNLAGQLKLIFAVCAAVTAPFLMNFGPSAEPGAFHFYGTSSHGKTTLLVLASSVWGKGAELKDAGIVFSWATTRFAAERKAQQHSDCAMFMDELKSADPDQFAHLALQITNGAGKMAGNSSGGLREDVVFRPMVLSTGEVSAKDYITSNKLTYHAGMAVRFVDIPADSQSGLGVFEFVPDTFEGASQFAQFIKAAAAQNYGHVGREFVRALLCHRDDMLSEIREVVEHLTEEMAEKNVHRDPQIARVTARFALVGAVGEIGCVRGLLPWNRAEVRAAAMSAFNSWIAARGGQGSLEGLAAEEAFNAFVFANAHRFSPAAERNRLGLKRWTKDLHLEIWVANKSGLNEILGQPERHDPFLKRLQDGLSEDWEFVPGTARPLRDSPKGHGLPKRSYCFRKRYPEPAEAAKDPEYSR